MSSRGSMRELKIKLPKNKFLVGIGMDEVYDEKDQVARWSKN